jgi:hypothetical protein
MLPGIGVYIEKGKKIKLTIVFFAILGSLEFVLEKE